MSFRAVGVLLIALLLLPALPAAAAARPTAEDVLIDEGPAGSQLLPPSTGSSGSIKGREIARLLGIPPRAGARLTAGHMRTWVTTESVLTAGAMIWQDASWAAQSFRNDLVGAVRSGESLERVPEVPGARIVGIPTPPNLPATMPAEMVVFRRGRATFAVVGVNFARRDLVQMAVAQHRRALRLLPPEAPAPLAVTPPAEHAEVAQPAQPAGAGQPQDAQPRHKKREPTAAKKPAAPSPGAVSATAATSPAPAIPTTTMALAGVALLLALAALMVLRRRWGSGGSVGGVIRATPGEWTSSL